MPGGEALARQFVAGKRFFLEQLGVDPPRCGCPTRSATPRRCRRSSRRPASRWFLTQKISWNETNVMPHHTFWLGGHRRHPDLHPLPAGGHLQRGAVRGRAGPGAAPVRREGPGEHLAGAVRLGRRRRRADPGDAGRRGPHPVPGGLADGADHLAPPSSSPPPRPSTRRRRCGPGSCTWSSTAAPTPPRPGPSGATGAASTCCARPSCGRPRPRCAAGSPTPTTCWRRCWQTVLLQQFHDILPGTSIAWVHQQAEREYARVAAELEEVIDTGAARARRGRASSSWSPTRAPTRWTGRRRWARGRPARGRRGRRSRRPPRASCWPTGRSGWWSTGAAWSPRCTTGGRPRGDPPGAPANLLQLFRDTPTQWDAWDIEEHYRRTGGDLVELAALTVEPGPAVRVVRSVGAVDDHPDAVAAAERPGARHRHRGRLGGAAEAAQAGLPAGRARGPGHLGDPVRAPAPADPHQHLVGRRPVRDLRTPLGARRRARLRGRGGQRRDLRPRHHAHTRPGGGTTTTVRLSLLRAPLFPDPHADQGRHRFAVALRVGATIGDAVAEGYRLNLPPRRFRGAREIAPLLAVTTRPWWSRR